MTFSRSASTTSVNRGNRGHHTRCSRHRGRVILRVNIQNSKGKAKAYQVRQVLMAIDKKEGE